MSIHTDAVGDHLDKEPPLAPSAGRFTARVLPAWERARIEVQDGRGSDLTVEVSELRDADTGQMFWTVSVRPYGEREVRVYTDESLEASLTWEKGEWE